MFIVSTNNNIIDEINMVFEGPLIIIYFLFSLYPLYQKNPLNHILM